MISKKEFTIAALNLKHNAFVAHVATLNVDLGNEIHPSKRAQIVQLIKVNKAFTKVPSKYVDFANVFLPKLAIELPKYEIHKYAIELMDDW